MAAKFRILGDGEEVRVKWPVSINMPADGGPAQMAFTAQFIILDADEMDAIIQADPAHAAANVLQKAWVGWEGVEGDAPFSVADRDRMLKYYFVSLGVFEAYNTCILGRAVKN